MPPESSAQSAATSAATSATTSAARSATTSAASSLRGSSFWLTALACALALLLLDAVWLGLIARDLYARQIGHLMAEQPLWPVALLFYAVYGLGLTRFVVMPAGPGAAAGSWAVAAAGFGLVAYATYDLSNWATLRGWPWQLALVDMAWGSAASVLAAAAGMATCTRLQRGRG